MGEQGEIGHCPRAVYCAGAAKKHVQAGSQDSEFQISDTNTEVRGLNGKYY